MTDVEREAWADALIERLTREATAFCCKPHGGGFICEYHQGFHDGCDEMWRALQDEADQ